MTPAEAAPDLFFENPAQQPADSLEAPLPDQTFRRAAANPAVEEILRNTAIVILTWNQVEETSRCLQSLVAAGYALDRIVLWDNGSVDGTDATILREFPDVVFHRHATNLGVASGRNAAALLAVRKLSPTHMLFLDNDMVVTPGFLESLCQPFVSRPRLAQTLAKIRILDEPQRLQSAGGLNVQFFLGSKSVVGYREIDNGQYDVQRPCLPSGGATLVAVSVFLLLDGFDPIFDPFGSEDLDFSLRVHESDYCALYVPDAVVYHDYHCKHIGGSDFAMRMQHWLILLRKHASLPEQIGFVLFGGPIGLLKIALREIMRGNIAAINGIPSGLRKCKNYLFRNRKGTQPQRGVGIQTD